MGFVRIFSVVILLVSSLAGARPLPLESILAKNPRVIIFSPHPDDDVLSSTGLMTSILALRAKGGIADLRVVYMTCGDAYDQALAITKKKGTAQTYLELGQLRHNEALNALKKVGVNSNKAIFLGFPDGGMDAIFNQKTDSSQPYTSPQTGASQVPYAFAYHAGEAYLKESVINDITKIINDFKPAVVFTPTLTDEHLDHRATREFVTQALSQIQNAPLHLEFLVHWEKTETDWPHATTDWQTPFNHVTAEYSLSLGDYGLTIDQKKEVIRNHVSQVDVESAYLQNFAKSTEVFWTSKPKRSDYLIVP